MCKVMQEYKNKATLKERLRNLTEMLKNGGTDEDLRKFLNATDEEIRQAHEAYHKPTET